MSVIIFSVQGEIMLMQNYNVCPIVSCHGCKFILTEKSIVILLIYINIAFGSFQC